ncbi:MAG TPA: sensor histidine kinase, partial [Pseudonocardiaceae bacterium]|nr:sensor histidine kinase [Pseudonocardiaceae bacterium]
DAQPELHRRHVDTARSLARDSLVEARRSVQALAPGPLQDARLPDAVADLAKRWAESTDVALTVQTTGEPRPLSIDLEVTLFRVAQEALANVAKHAAASKVGVTLSYMDEVVVLDVRDDGVGFDTGGAGPDPGRSGPARGPGFGAGFGLSAMRQRVARVSGRLDVESSPGAGTAVSASVPLIGPERAA